MSEQPEPTHDLFISYAEADGAWVEGYLIDALSQAGMRVHSEAAFRLGVPRLLQFERAIKESRRTLLVLSPAYLAGDFTGFTDLLAQSYGLEGATWPVIPLILKPVRLPSRLSMLEGLDATDPDRWPEVIERLCAELERPVPGPPPVPPCPYPGMVPFSEADRDRFFGRDEEVGFLLRQLRLHPFLTVIGPSGSGKSSLVFAGLVPTLRKSNLFSSPGQPGPGGWLVRSLRPGSTPLATLTAALDSDSWDPARTVSALLATQPGARRLLLIVDQFEELFTRARANVEAFQEALLRMVEIPECYVVVTVRADFYPDLMAGPLWPAIQAHRAEVLPLDRDGLRQAIVRPAEDVGVFVDPALVERLIDDAAGEPGILPFVQETLVLLWQQVTRRYLPLEAYNSLIETARRFREPGAARLTGLQVAMADRAEAALQALSPEEQIIARRIFLRLIQFGEGRADTRRQLRVSQLRSDGDDQAAFDDALAHLADHRLLTLSGEETRGGRRVDIAHEALIQGWPTLQEWLVERREAEQTRRRLEVKAREWLRLGRKGGILEEVELLEAEQWLESPDAAEMGVSEAQRDLVRASRRTIEEVERREEEALQRELAQAQALAAEAEARRRAEQQRAEEAEANQRAQAQAAKNLLRLVVLLAGVLVLALAAIVFALQQSRLATTRQLLAQAQTALIQERYHEAMLLAVEANKLDSRAGIGVLGQIPFDVPYMKALSLEGHTEEVRSVAWHPDGDKLASGSWDNRVIVWDAQSGQALKTLDGHTGSVRSAAWHPEGRLLASGSWDERIFIWDTDTGLIVTTLEADGPIRSVAWHPDGHLLASGSDNGRVTLWDSETGQAVTTLDGHTDEVWSVAWHPDGRILASGSGDRRIILWDTQTGEPISSLRGHRGSIRSLAWQPDTPEDTGGAILASGSGDRRIILWNISTELDTGTGTGRAIATMRGHSSPVSSVAWRPDGHTLVSGSEDGRIIFWDISAEPDTDTVTGKAVTTLTGYVDAVNSVAWHPKATRLASGSRDKHIILWDPETAAETATLKSHTDPVWGVAWHPDGHILASGSQDERILLWDTQTGQAITSLTGHTGTVRSLAWQSDGGELASGAEDGRVFIWDVSSAGAVTASPVITLEGHTDTVTGVDWHPDSRLLASASEDGKVIIWDTQTGEAIATLEADTDIVWSVAWHPGGRFLASGADDGRIVVWDMETGEATAILAGHTGAVRSVAWHPGTPATFDPGAGDHILASGSEDRRIVLWGISTGLDADVSAGLEAGVSAGLEAGVSADPDTGTLNGEAIAILPGHADAVRSLAWHPNGRLLASGSGDRSIIVWSISKATDSETMTGEAVSTLYGHLDLVNSVAWSADGHSLASGSSDETVQLLPAVYAQPTCERLAYNLSLPQWRQYRGSAIYQPTCDNLPASEVPGSANLLLADPGLLLLTYQGRLWFLVGIILLSAPVALVFWGGLRLVRWIVGRVVRSRQ